MSCVLVGQDRRNQTVERSMGPPRCARLAGGHAEEHGGLSPRPPEGASTIVHHDVDHAEEMTRPQRVGSHDLLEDGTVAPDRPSRPSALTARSRAA